MENPNASATPASKFCSQTKVHCTLFGRQPKHQKKKRLCYYLSAPNKLFWFTSTDKIWRLCDSHNRILAPSSKTLYSPVKWSTVDAFWHRSRQEPLSSTNINSNSKKGTGQKKKKNYQLEVTLFRIRIKEPSSQVTIWIFVEYKRTFITSGPHKFQPSTDFTAYVTSLKLYLHYSLKNVPPTLFSCHFRHLHLDHLNCIVHFTEYSGFQGEMSKATKESNKEQEGDAPTAKFTYSGEFHVSHFTLHNRPLFTGSPPILPQMHNFHW